MRASGIVAVFVAVIATSAARADDDEAAKQFDSGRQLFKGKKYVQAALAFEAAAAQKQHPLALYSAGLAWEQADRPDRAADDFGRALKLEGLSAGDAARAKESLEAFERTLGTLAVTAPTGWSVQVEGNSMVPTPARVHAAPGTRTLLVLAPGRPVARKDVAFDAGKESAIELKEDVFADPNAARTTVVSAAPKVMVVEIEKPGETRRAIGFGVLGLGLAAIGAGAVLGLQTLDGRDAYKTSPSPELESHVHGLETWTNVALISGAIVTIAGAALIFWPTSSKATTKQVGKLTF